MEKPKVISNLGVLTIALLPLVLNILITPVIIVLAVSLPEFLRAPYYYVYAYGPILWSVYHILLALLAWRFLGKEGETLRGIAGSLGDRVWFSIVTILGLLGLSVLLFQVVETVVSGAIYGPQMMEQVLSEYRRVPLALALYCIVVTSLTAGVCEEIVWRGYLQTRLEQKLRGRIWTAVSIQAVLFGLWHSVSIHSIFTAVFGFISGLIYARTRRLFPIMVSHWLGDVIGFSALYFLAT